MEKDLKKILDEIQRYSADGNRRALTIALRQIMNKRRDYYHKSIEENLVHEYSEALYKILLLEIDEEEEDSIETAELTYLGICSLLLREGATQEYYKRRMLLLHYFSDYFTDAVVEIFLKTYRKDNLLAARSLALECLEKMQLSDISYLEENAPEFLNRDEELTDACNGIATNPDLSEEELANALLLHKVMNAYLAAKYKN